MKANYIQVKKSVKLTPMSFKKRFFRVHRIYNTHGTIYLLSYYKAHVNHKHTERNHTAFSTPSVTNVVWQCYCTKANLNLKVQIDQKS